VIIPPIIDSCVVTHIAKYAFSNKRTLTGVSIPDCVTHIEDHAFNGCDRLASITIPNSVTHIGTGAFSGCVCLTDIDVDSSNPVYTSVNGVLFTKDQTEIVMWPPGRAGDITIPHGAISIGEYAFLNCSKLTSITISDSITKVGDWAFTGCFCRIINIPDSITSIGEYAFWDCPFLYSITIPKNVTSIGAGALLGCEELYEINVDKENCFYSSMNGVLFNKSRTEIIQHPANIEGEYVIPDGTTHIASGAFDGCKCLSKITIAESVMEIGTAAFYKCKSLSSIAIYGNALEDIMYHYSDLIDEAGLFFGGDKLPSEVGIFEKCQNFTDLYIFASIGELPKPDYPKHYHGIGLIDALREMKSIRSVWVEEDHALYSVIDGMIANKDQTELLLCPHSLIGSVVIPKSIKELRGELAHHVGIIRIIIQEGVTIINDESFIGCTHLETIEIPSSVRRICLSAFNECTNLLSVIVATHNPDYSSMNGVLYNKNCTHLLLVPYGLSGAFRIPFSVTEISDQAFDECIHITEIEIPDSVTKIGYRAFGDCTSVTNLKIPKNVIEIGKDAFETCANLKDISVDEENSFYSSDSGVLFNKEKTDLIRCPNGKVGTVTVPTGVTTIRDGAFRDCSKLTHVTLPPSVKTVGKEAFSGCVDLDSESTAEITSRGGADAFESTPL